ncbi:hypothetical protein Tco_0176181 [Tanacetum coccineum]
MNKLSSSYANKLSPESLTKANLRKLEVNVLNGDDCDVWLHVASVHEEKYGLEKVTLVKGFFFFKFASIEGVDYVKFHDVPLVAFSSDGLSMMATKIGTPMMLDTHMNFMCLESWRRSSYAKILIEINACNDFSDQLVMVVPNC